MWASAPAPLEAQPRALRQAEQLRLERHSQPLLPSLVQMAEVRTPETRVCEVREKLPQSVFRRRILFPIEPNLTPSPSRRRLL